MFKKYFFFFTLLCSSSFAAPSDPQLLIRLPNGTIRLFSTKEILSHPKARMVEVAKDPAYNNMRLGYKAVPLSELFRGVDLSTITTLNFISLDGFSGVIDKNRAFNTSKTGSVAYIAAESRKQKWLPLQPNKPESAGPFYLIWEDPEKSKIQTEEWPFQLKELEAKNISLEAQYPTLTPDPKIKEAELLQKGFKSFMTNCFVCHAMDSVGKNKIGPDLNLPFSATEYLSFHHFKILVRDPQSLRRWPDSKMNGFTKDMLSDEELTSIWKYLQYKADHKTVAK